MEHWCIVKLWSSRWRFHSLLWSLVIHDHGTCSFLWTRVDPFHTSLAAAVYHWRHMPHLPPILNRIRQNNAFLLLQLVCISFVHAAYNSSISCAEAHFKITAKWTVAKHGNSKMPRRLAQGLRTHSTGTNWCTTSEQHVWYSLKNINEFQVPESEFSGSVCLP